MLLNVSFYHPARLHASAPKPARLASAASICADFNIGKSREGDLEDGIRGPWSELSPLNALQDGKDHHGSQSDPPTSNRQNFRGALAGNFSSSNPCLEWLR